MKKVIKHCISLSYMVAVSGGCLLLLLSTLFEFDIREIPQAILIGVVIGMFFIHPFVLTLMNAVFLFISTADEQVLKKAKQVDILTVLEGGLYSCLWLSFCDIKWVDWTETLYNSQTHTPIWTEGVLTIVVFAVVGFLGYLFLSYIKVSKTPPLLVVCAMSAMYLGMLMCILWMVQIFGHGMEELLLCLFPGNCLIIGIRVIWEKVVEWRKNQEEQPKEFTNPFLNMLNKKLLNSANWCVFALVFMIPLLGIVIGILVLFGQQPDAVIRAWTETSDWTLSTKVAPQNIIYDEHYLCTVAAGGHKKVVKPLRMGERHGHPVIVNRQLCVANAFEQILEEKTPRFHKCVRGFYDKYGFPIAKCIKSPYVADMIYFMMKPLEWIFLVVLYMVDINPENRISVQYISPQSRAALEKSMR